MQINVLGTMYTIKESNKVDDPALNECDGYCDDTTKMCVIDSMDCSDAMAKGNMNVILSILVDTFFTRISMPKLRHPEIHNISAA